MAAAFALTLLVEGFAVVVFPVTIKIKKDHLRKNNQILFYGTLKFPNRDVMPALVYFVTP